MSSLLPSLQEENAPCKVLEKTPKHAQNRAKNKRNAALLSANADDDEIPDNPIEEEEGEKGPVTKLYGEKQDTTYYGTTEGSLGRTRA